MILHDVETKTHVAATWFLTDAKTATRDKIKNLKTKSSKMTTNDKRKF